MNEKNKIILLKEITKGFATNGEVRGIAKSDGKTLNLSIINLKKGNYEILFFCGDELKRELLPTLTGGKVLLLREIKSLLIAEKGESGLIPVAFGKFTQNGESWEGIVKYAQKQIENQDETEVEDTIFSKEEYDDEAVATYDYYEYDKRGVEIDADETKGDGFYRKPNEDNREKAQARYQASDKYDENDVFKESDTKRGELFSFVEKIAEEIEPLFKKHPSEENLTKMVAGSKWAKVTTESGKYYALGIIYKNGSPKYICYGLPSDFYSPPREMCGYKSFIPLSSFDLKGSGYWVMYQDALTGKGL